MKQCALCGYMRPDRDVDAGVCRDTAACKVRQERQRKAREPVVVRAPEEQTACG